MRRHRKHIDDYDVDDETGIIPDGQGVHVPMMMMDSAQPEVTEYFDQQTVVRDRLAAHNRYAAHKPGPVQDALRQGAGQAIKDASYDLHERRGTWLQEAFRMRDEAFAELEKRSQNAWRMKTDAKTAAPSDDDPDADDDDDNVVEIDDLEAARKARDRAYQAAVERSANAWKSSPGRATQVESQRQQWTAERPWNRSGL